MPATADWTVEQLLALPDEPGKQYEIIDGELFVTPSPAWRHQYALDEVHARIREYLGRERLGVVLFAPADVIFGPRTLVQPDVLVAPLVEGHRPTDFSEAGRLLLAVEVLSPSTAARDRGVKRKLYQREGVPEYWIVDLDACLIERWRPTDDRPEIVRERLEWLPEGASRPFVMNMREFFEAIGEK